MSLNLTQEELDFIAEKRPLGFNIDVNYTTPDVEKNEGFSWLDLPTGRKILAIHHYEPDTLTIYAVEEAPVPEPMEKLANFLNANPDVRELLGL
jgi:hypothetical protein